MQSDVSRSDCAEQSVRQGVQRDVRIRMAVQSFVKGDFDVAKRDGIPPFEFVYVETGGRPDVRGFRRQPFFRADQVLSRRDFHIVFVACGQHDGQPALFGDRGVVRQLHSRGLFMRF